MTLGNNPQPLTRRQLRELAAEQDASTSSDEPATASIAISTEPRASSTESSFTELIQKAEAAAKAAAVPRAGERRVSVLPDSLRPDSMLADSMLADSSLSELTDADYFDSLDRTLTRRELRALKAAQEEAGEGADGVDSVDLVDDADDIDDAELINDLDLVDDVDPVDSDDGPRELHPPVGHWSIDPDDDSEAVAEHTRTLDQVHQFDQIIALGLGAGGVPTTTNALILPDMSHQDRTAGPFASTGEILITGSIDLPRSLGSTGAHPDRFDSADVDHMLDQLDEAGAGSDVAPVSASRAVSSHTSTRGVMTAPKKEIVWLPTVLAVTAAALALGVIALFVGAFVFNIF
ncbi:hypothetical protein AB4Y63_17240 [Leifsonia sp. YAF41]|uniref:hypothetical protein n=1 Tax=Leifsonia sp. YAF41 TaxID=3233086 RepID=UPI003F9B1A9A